MTTTFNISPITLQKIVDAISARQSVGPTSLDLPAWVQAVGSIVAILASVWIAQRETRQRRREKIATDGNFALFIGNATNSLVTNVTRILDDFTKKLAATESEECSYEYLKNLFVMATNEIRMSLDHIPAMVRSIPLSEWPDMQFAYIFHDNVREVEELARIIDRSLAVVSNADDEEACYTEVRGITVALQDNAEFFEYNFDSTMNVVAIYVGAARKARVRLNDKMPPAKPWETTSE